MKRGALIVAALVAATITLSACTPTPAPTPAPQRILVIGDETSAAWVEVLEGDHGASIELDAQSGSGYLTASPDAVADRVAVASGAPIIVLALGAADAGFDVPEEIREATARQGIGAAAAEAGRVLVLPPAGAPSPGAVAWAETLQQVAEAAGVEFLALDPAESSGPEAERAIASRVAEALG